MLGKFVSFVKNLGPRGNGAHDYNFVIGGNAYVPNIVSLLTY
jgi:hypothetical protein